MRRGLIEQLVPPLLDMHAAEWQPNGGYVIRGDARRFENWETYYAGKVGLGAAYDVAWCLAATMVLASSAAVDAGVLAIGAFAGPLPAK